MHLGNSSTFPITTIWIRRDDCEGCVTNSKVVIIRFEIQEHKINVYYCYIILSLDYA